MYSQDLFDQWEYFLDSKEYDKLYGLLGSLFVESNTNSASLCMFIFSAHDYYFIQPFYVSTCSTFKQELRKQFHFTTFHISVLTMIIPDCWRFMNQCAQLGTPETHALLVPQAQAGPTHHSSITGSRFPSKPGLQAAAPESQTQCGAQTSTIPAFNQSVRKEPEPMTREQRVFPAPINMCLG